MAKQSMVQREKTRKRLVTKYSAMRESIKKEVKQTKLFPARFALYGKLQRMPRNSSSSRQRNRCWITGRSRGFYRDFGLCRNQLRQRAHNGELPGLVKSSW